MCMYSALEASNDAKTVCAQPFLQLVFTYTHIVTVLCNSGGGCELWKCDYCHSVNVHIYMYVSWF